MVGATLAVHGPPPGEDLIQLAGKLLHHFTTIRDQHPDGTKPLVDLISELKSLYTSLQRHDEVTKLTGKEPPALGAVAETLKRGQDIVNKHEDVFSASSHSDLCRRDSGGNWATFEHDLVTLRHGVLQCGLLLRNLIFATVLNEGLIDADTSSQYTLAIEYSMLTDSGKELVDILQKFVRIRNIYCRIATPRGSLARSGISQQLAALESKKDPLISRLLDFVELESHLLETLELPDLILACDTEYQEAVVSIGTLAVRRENDIPPKHRTLSARDCEVTIKLPRHPDIKGTRFQMFDDRCRWLGQGSVLLLEHVFSLPTERRYPWKHFVHSPLTVAFTAYQTRGSKVECFHSHQGVHPDQAPEYVFANTAGYELFQSSMRKRRFVKEYELVTIKPKGPQATSTSRHEFIKIWFSENSGLTMTIPVTFPNDEVRNQELALRWFKWDRVGSVGLKLELKQASKRPPASSPASSNSSVTGKSRLFVRRFSNLSKPIFSSSSTPVIDERSTAPEEWTRMFHLFSLEFKDRDSRDDLASLFEPGAHRNIPHLELPEPSLSSEPLPTKISRTTIVTSPQYMSLEGHEISANPSSEDIPLDPLKHSLLRRGGPQSQPIGVITTQQDISYQQSFYSSLPADAEYIRLLRIDPGQARTEISVSWELHRLEGENRPQYGALSYCWQKSGDTRILAEGGLKGFEVSLHVWSALRRLRHRDRPRFIWIDAICINQYDIAEKSKQIALLQQIYTKAFRTIIWIGDSHSEMQTCSRSFLAEGDSQATLCPVKGYAALDHKGMAQELRKDLQRLQDFDNKNDLANVWWKRLWCIQEFHFSTLTPTVYLGPHAVSWEYFNKLFEHDTDPLSLFQTLRTPQDHTLFDLLAMTGAYRCTDPRDRIYALLSMAQHSAFQIQVNYGHSVIRVIEAACERLIVDSGSVDVLLDRRASRIAWGIGSDKATGVVPTWIPDLTCLQQRYEIRSPSQFKWGRPDKFAAGSGVADARVVDDVLDGPLPLRRYDAAKTLLLKCVYFSTVKARTAKSDIQQHEHSHDNCLIYNSLLERGAVIRRILDVLSYDYRSHERLVKDMDIDPSPCIGRLFLHYLFDGKRSIKKEIKRRDLGPERDLLTSYKRQEKEDLSYVEHERSPKDIEYVKERWTHKTSRAKANITDIPDRIRPALGNRKNNQDFSIARDFENLFAYARHSKERYYFTGTNFDAPMRRDVLQSKNLSEVKMLETQYDSQALDLEFHEYSPKSREQDFFKTESEFLGLGPAAMEVGDEIIIPFGSSWPWIVRKHDAIPGGVEDYYEFIGECVVPSIMAGRWMDKEQEHPVTYRIR